MEKKKVVILGTGFGGIYTFLNLKKILDISLLDVTLVNSTNYFLFTPLLHEVATGGLNQTHVVESIREIMQGCPCDFYQANIESIDNVNKKINTTLGDISYDYLVIALGATTNFYGIPGADKSSFVLKNVEDAIKLKDKFIDVFEKASKIKDPVERKSLVSFAVVGGGATGVELAGEIAEFIYDTFAKFYGDLVKESEIYLLNSGSELLAQFHPDLRKKSLDTLTKKGIKVILNCAVSEVTSQGVSLKDGKVLPLNNVVWVAGVKPNTPKFLQEVELDKSGRIVVDEFLRVKKHSDIFALGDVASVTTKAGALPMLAQVAVEESKTVAKNIAQSISGKPLKALKEFKLKGSLVSLGQWNAVGDLFGFRVFGPHIWWLWRTIYLFKFISFAKKFKIALDWTYNIFCPRDISKPD